ncbi:phospholipid scramblase 1 [Danio aesculapii]|uniref:phospholipid scramblase 1 n=1 Tax=Danio aesculapii TaxID=1142201 RepID=UPI0024C0D838|nr:phospholipid scramblase 1 [Danio aesculapii]
MWTMEVTSGLQQDCINVKSNMELSEFTMMMPGPDPYHSADLETLTMIDQFFVYKERNMDECIDEVCCGKNADIRYTVKDDIGNLVFNILEDSDYCSRNIHTGRSFTMNIVNDSNKEVIRLEHPFICCSCSGHEVEVQSPPGVPIGHVGQNWRVCQPKFTVKNNQHEPEFRIVGPCVPLSFCVDQEFELVSLSGSVFGKIVKPFSCSCVNVDADFVLQFPINLEDKMKATLLGTCVLIDFVYYDPPKQPLLGLLSAFK